MKHKRITQEDLKDFDLKLTLLELMIYFKMSYPAGLNDTCEVQLNDKRAVITTPDITYTIDNNCYIDLHLRSNQMIATMYQSFVNTTEGSEE